uniref:Uncharacterized protein n=1 Tax=Arundo donax TaxID=35708 RepID=A0A0A9EWN7_ARUDO
MHAQRAKASDGRTPVAAACHSHAPKRGRSRAPASSPLPPTSTRASPAAAAHSASELPVRPVPRGAPSSVAMPCHHTTRRLAVCHASRRAAAPRGQCGPTTPPWVPRAFASRRPAGRPRATLPPRASLCPSTS